MDSLSHEIKKGSGAIVSWEMGVRGRAAAEWQVVGENPGRKLLLLAEFSVLNTLVNSRKKEHILSVIGRILFLLCCAACHLLPLWSQSTLVFPALSY